MRRQSSIWGLVLLLYLMLPCRAAASSYAIEINLPALRLYLYQQGELLRDYPVAVGKPSTQTPMGSFQIINKQHNPTWYPAGRKPVPPGPNNPLGQWWLGLSAKGYGIHGCLNESSIGQPVSKGCIRMHNRDVAELVKLVGVGTPVRIMYQPYTVREDRLTGQVWLWSGQDIYRRATTVDSALDYLRRATSCRWQMEATRALLAKRVGTGWQEIPLAIDVYRRDRLSGQAYQVDGKVWLSRKIMSSLPGGGVFTVGEGDVSLEDLANATLDWVDWRYDPSAQKVMAYPARLRIGDEWREDAVRLVQGRVMVSTGALRALLDITGEERIAGAGNITRDALTPPALREEWVSAGTSLGNGWRVWWSEETWEAVVEREA